MTHTVESSWRETRRAALLALAVALEDTLQHVDDVENALYREPETLGAGDRPDEIVVAGRAYTALLRSRVRELRAEADQLVTT